MARPQKIGYGAAMPLPDRLERLLTPERRLLLRQFVQFATVGFAGLGVDIAVVYLARGSIGVYAAGLLSFVFAVTVTFALNRAWTFAGQGEGSLLVQWARFVAANSFGLVLNRGTFFLLVALVPLCEQHPVFAIFAGVLAGMFVNFSLSRRLVFRAPAA